jgi:hypothetical protein
MIVDVHTHTPAFRGPVPPERVEMNTKWRPDRAVKATTSWDDYLVAQRPADKSIVFGPGTPAPRTTTASRAQATAGTPGTSTTRARPSCARTPTG